MTIDLTESELAFLCSLLQPYLEYYAALASMPNYTAASRAKWEELDALEAKLILRYKRAR